MRLKILNQISRIYCKFTKAINLTFSQPRRFTGFLMFPLEILFSVGGWDFKTKEMKREIKFRAWDGKRMLKNIGVHPHMIKSLVKIPNCENQDSDCEYKADDEGAYIISPMFNKYHIMQFTGLHDKNGKEIYEGDIAEYCEVDDHNHLLSNITFPILIEYNNAWAQFGWSDGGAWFELDHFRIKEVIGNIYENPELLK